MDKTVLSILLFVLGLGIGLALVFLFNFLKNKKDSNKADTIIDKAKKEAEKIKRDSLFETKEEIHKLKLEADKEIKEKKSEVKEQEDRLLQRENNIDRRDTALQNRETALEERENNLLDKQQKIQEAKEEMEEIKRKELEELERISKYTKEQARDAVMKMVETKMSKEIAAYIKEMESEAKLEVDERAKELLVGTMQKYAADITSEQTVSVIALPNDEMKGRLIGREGRNIRTIESVTGVDLIIDDTPEAIVISSFDPLRREIARLTLETLIKDGRIHPARIEELYAKTCTDVKQTIKEFEEQLNNNLYKLWNRMASGSYFPKPVRAVAIPKKNGGTRILGIPTVEDRIAQMVAKMYFEPLVEPMFYNDSYGYRPNKSAIQAVGQARERCFKRDWVLELDIKGLFDNIKHGYLMYMVEKHTQSKWLILYIKRWLTVPFIMSDGTVVERKAGTPQGGVISPILANLFLHYVFDDYMSKA